MASANSPLDLGAVWRAPTAALRVQALAAAALARLGRVSGPRWAGALAAALEEELVPFGTDLYADLAREQAGSPEGMAAFLVARAQRKAAEATRLRSLAGAAGDPAERALLDWLAGLDAEQVVVALALFDAAFPGALGPGDRAALDAVGARPEEDGAALAAPAPRQALPDELLDLQIDRLRQVVHAILVAELMPGFAAGERLARVESAARVAIAAELAAAGRLASFLEAATGGVAADALAPWIAARIARFERLSVDEPIELHYAIRFGQYP